MPSIRLKWCRTLASCAALVSPLVGAACLATAAETVAIGQPVSVQPLPPVMQESRPSGGAWSSAPTSFGDAADRAPAMVYGQPAESLVSDDATTEQIVTSIGNDPSIVAMRPVAWSALDIAQWTVPQGIYVGADYLLLRPRMSEPIAFLAGGGDHHISGNAYTFDFQYQSAPRAFIGLRDPTTGSALQFTYWYFQETTSANFGTSDPNSGVIPATSLIWFLMDKDNNGGGGGGDPKFIDSQMRMRLNVFDIEFFKPLAFNGGRWLFTGSVGARILDYNQSINSLAADENRAPVFAQSMGIAFTGAGPRLGLEVRRTVGANGALYVRGGYALLVGSHSGTLEISDPSADRSFNLRENLSRTVSVADIELGGAWRYGQHVTLSAGWMVAAFTDLSGTVGTFNLTDNANILSFDGLVARAAYQF